MIDQSIRHCYLPNNQSIDFTYEIQNPIWWNLGEEVIMKEMNKKELKEKAIKVFKKEYKDEESFKKDYMASAKRISDLRPAIVAAQNVITTGPFLSEATHWEYYASLALSYVQINLSLPEVMTGPEPWSFDEIAKVTVTVRNNTNLLLRDTVLKFWVESGPAKVVFWPDFFDWGFGGPPNLFWPAPGEKCLFSMNPGDTRTTYFYMTGSGPSIETTHEVIYRANISAEIVPYVSRRDASINSHPIHPA
jgi:hypothetical protein